VKVLVAAGRPPWPPWRGDQLRARQLCEALAVAHEVTLLAPAAPDEPPAPGGARRERFRLRAAPWAALAAAPGLLRGWPLQALPFRQPDFGRRLRALAPEHDLVVLVLARLLPHVREVGRTPLVTDLIDSLSLNASTRAAVDAPPLRPLLRAEARRMAAAESTVVAASRTALVVCARDRDALAAALPPALAARLVVAPVAVAPQTAVMATPPPLAGSIVLTGNLGYFPNRDALRSFLDGPWPALRRAVPGARLTVAGDRPPSRLAARLVQEGATLVARPPDLRALLAGAAVAVAPMRCGSGVPLKVLDAWAAGVPVVATPFAAAGAGGEGERDLLLAASTEEWVAQMRRLLDDGELARRLVAGGRARLAELAPERVYPLLRERITGAA